MANVAAMSMQERVAEAMRRSIPLLPDSSGAAVQAMLAPESVAIVAATLIVWAGSHFFGVGEIVDIILLVAGVFALGFSAFSGARKLYGFAETSVNARTDAGLDKAAGLFAEAVVILGISTIQAILLRGATKAVIARGTPQIKPLPAVGAPPPPGNQLRLARPATLPGGDLGTTDAFGAIAIARNQSLSEQRLTLFHELVHRYFSPRTGPLRKLRAQLNMSAYDRSSFLKYLEEALAEGYAQLKVNGLAGALQAYKFPVDSGYVTVSQLAGEAGVIGTISLGGATFYVSIATGGPPR